MNGQRVHLACRCSRRLDTLESTMLGVLPRHATRDGHILRPSSPRAIARGGQAPTSRWRWQCRRCRASVVLRQSTLTAAYDQALADGRRQVVVGVDL